MNVNLASKLGTSFRAALSAHIISGISGAVLVVVLARILDPNGYGLLYLAIGIIGSIKIFSKLGIAKSTGRYIAEYKNKSPDQITNIVLFSFKLNLATISVVVITLYFGRDYIADIVGEPEIAQFILYGTGLILFGTIFTLNNRILQGLEEITIASRLRAIEEVCKSLLAITLAVLGFGAIGAFVGYIIGFAIAVVLGMWYITTQFLRVSDYSSMSKNLKVDITKYAVPLTATSTANVLDKRVDIILIGFFLSPISVAYYTISKQIIQFIETPMSALAFVLSPAFGSLKASDDLEAVAEIYEEALFHSLLLYIPATAGLILVSDPLINIVFGEDYSGGVIVLQVLAAYAILRSVAKITSGGLDYLGRARHRAYAKGITSILNVGLNILLIPLYGVVGAAAATVITHTIYTFVNVCIMFTEIRFNTIKTIKNIIYILIITIIMSVIVSELLLFIGSLFELLIVVVVGASIWFFLSVATGLLDINRIVGVIF